MTLRAAPAVTVRCAGGVAWAFSLVALPALAAGVLVVWAALQLSQAPAFKGESGFFSASGWGFATAIAVAVVLAVVLAVAAMRTAGWATLVRTETTLLCWDGAEWTSNGMPVHPQVMVDTGGDWMLLRLHPAVGAAQQHSRPLMGGSPGARWVAVSASDAGTRWLALRIALYGFQASHAGQGLEPPSL
jgi:hypothetical protein